MVTPPPSMKILGCPDLHHSGYPPRLLPVGTAVSFLLSGPGRWSKDRVRMYFLPEEVELILNLPLSSSPSTDQVLWHYESNDIFSVKSAYNFARLSHGSGEPSSSSGPLFLWKKIWTLSLRSKIKIFCWKACKNILPTKGLLFSRKILDEAACPLCRSASKSVDHALWQCQVASALWGSCPLRQDSFFGSHPFVDFKDMLAYLISVLGISVASQFVASSWYIWLSQNATVHGKSPPYKEDCWVRAGCFISAFEHVKVISSSSVLPPRQSVWSPPPSGLFKLNSDVALNKVKKKVGLGIVIRDHSGAVCFATGLYMSQISDVELAETSALLKGLSLAV